jgi:hypothetical protein
LKSALVSASTRLMYSSVSKSSWKFSSVIRPS